LHKVILIGNLGRDPEMRYTPNGASVTSFSVASTYKYTTSNGESKEEVEWFNVSAWGRLSEICNQYLARGRQVYVEGRLSSRTYQTQDGQTRVSLDVNAENVHFLNNRQDDQGTSQNNDSPPQFGESQQANNSEYDDDDLPF
jgi:single-strand DNA-binding protein